MGLAQQQAQAGQDLAEDQRRKAEELKAYEDTKAHELTESQKEASKGATDI